MIFLYFLKVISDFNEYIIIGGIFMDENKLKDLIINHFKSNAHFAEVANLYLSDDQKISDPSQLQDLSLDLDYLDYYCVLLPVTRKPIKTIAKRIGNNIYIMFFGIGGDIIDSIVTSIYEAAYYTKWYYFLKEDNSRPTIHSLILCNPKLKDQPSVPVN